MATTNVRVRPVPGNRKKRVLVYNNEDSVAKPVFDIKIDMAVYDSLSAGEKTAVVAAADIATIIAATYTN